MDVLSVLQTNQGHPESRICLHDKVGIETPIKDAERASCCRGGRVYTEKAPRSIELLAKSRHHFDGFSTD